MADESLSATRIFDTMTGLFLSKTKKIEIIKFKKENLKKKKSEENNELIYMYIYIYIA